MTRVYRVLREIYADKPFNGEGAYRYGGRWSSPGTRVCYASEHQSLAMLEYFVHLDADDPPDDLVLAVADVPAELPRETIEINRLPANWRQTPAPTELARLGDDFVQRAETALLLVPSVLATSEHNWLVNPQHADFAKITVGRVEPLSFDPRMLGKRAGMARHGRK